MTTQEILTEMLDCMKRIEDAIKALSIPQAQATLPPAAPGGDFGPITEAEMNDCFPKGWPFGREKGCSLWKVPQHSLEWFIENRPPDKGSNFYQKNKKQYDLVLRWLAELKKLKQGNGGQRPEELKHKPEPEPVSERSYPDPDEPQELPDDQIPF